MHNPDPPPSSVRSEWPGDADLRPEPMVQTNAFPPPSPRLEPMVQTHPLPLPPSEEPLDAQTTNALWVKCAYNFRCHGKTAVILAVDHGWYRCYACSAVCCRWCLCRKRLEGGHGAVTAVCAPCLEKEVSVLTYII